MTDIAKSLNTQCRTCFNAAKGWNSLKAKTKDCRRRLKSYGKLLEEVTKINALDDENLPQVICGQCSRRLKFAHRFVQQVAEVEKKLYSMLNEKLYSCQETHIDLKSGIEIKVEQNDGEFEEKIEGLQEKQIELEEPYLEIKVEKSKLQTATVENWFCVPKFKPGIESGVEIQNNKNNGLEQERINLNMVHNLDVSIKNSDTESHILSQSNEHDKDCSESLQTYTESKILVKTKHSQSNNDEHDSDPFQSDVSDLEESKNLSKKKSIKQKLKTANEKQSETESQTTLSCSMCYEIYPNAKELAAHQKTSHASEKKKFICPLCGNRYRHASSMYAHLRTVHGLNTAPILKVLKPESDYIFECNKCPKKYSQKFHLVEHMKSKHFTTPVEKKEKRKRVDEGSLCPICGKFFTTRNHMIAHSRSHSGERPFKCDLCDRSFLINAQLNRHKRQHTGYKPYKCQECGKCFAAPKDVRQHMMVHSDERPHKCPLCECSYKFSTCLKIHMVTHTDERPFVCTVCGDSFNRSSSLRAHRKRHEKRVIDTETE